MIDVRDLSPITLVNKGERFCIISIISPFKPSLLFIFFIRREGDEYEYLVLRFNQESGELLYKNNLNL